jgi:hypothetical protein
MTDALETMTIELKKSSAVLMSTTTSTTLADHQFCRFYWIPESSFQ